MLFFNKQIESSSSFSSSDDHNDGNDILVHMNVILIVSCK